MEDDENRVQSGTPSHNGQSASEHIGNSFTFVDLPNGVYMPNSSPMLGDPIAFNRHKSQNLYTNTETSPQGL
mgnify:CR=1 FL=1